jgi:hypothetical protein
MTWPYSPHPVGGQNEVENGKVVTSISGGGMLSGFNAKMTNADWNHSVAYHRPDWNEKAEDSHPGRGAYSNFFEASIYATDEIPEGMEVFISYGENYEEEHATKEEEELSKEDMVKLDMTVDKMIDFFDKHKDELDEDSKAEVYEFLILDVMQAAAGTQKGKLIADMLPESPDELKQIKEQGGILDFSRPGMVRRLDWLEKHGMCMDNIRPGPSTIPHAGRGAFATRAFGEGGRIAPSPMLQIADEEVMLMYELKTEYDETEDEDYSVRYGESPVNTQLLLNYCFGHPESRMLLLPAGSGVSLINHSKKPNAKLVWSDHPSHHSHWLTLSPEELMEEGNRYLGLLMEVVAIKDIEEGDEIFIDYGSLWQAAWDKHVAEWEKGKGRKRILQKWPIRALDLNNQYSNKTFTPKAEYPENVEMRCFLIISKPPEGEPTTNENGDKIRHWKKHTHKESIDSSNLFDCSVSEVQEEKGEDGDYQYTIEWVSALSGATTIVKNVPHKAIVFQDKPNTSDHFTADAFRHYIELPDTVFPEGPWRDVEEE